MKIGPKYKIARKLGAHVFEKTQTQKYSLREERKLKRKSLRPKTDFGNQLNEKQKARMFYCITEKQFAGYVKNSLANKNGNPMSNLLYALEHRLDNVVWRAGILPTHLASRQAVAHGHFLVNGKRVYTPSYQLKAGDKVSIREGSKNSKLFAELETKIQQSQMPAWLSWDNKNKVISVNSGSFSQTTDLLFDLGQVIEYYQR
jgi:small subunit ribosomal protein S4